MCSCSCRNKTPWISSSSSSAIATVAASGSGMTDSGSTSSSRFHSSFGSSLYLMSIAFGGFDLGFQRLVLFLHLLQLRLQRRHLDDQATDDQLNLLFDCLHIFSTARLLPTPER